MVPAASWVLEDLAPLEAHSCLVGYDVRGRGRSSAVTGDTPFGLDQDLEDLEVLRKARGLERMAILGWSYYGLLAARYALAYPERVERLVLVGPSAPRRRPFLDDFMDRFAGRLDLERLEEVERLRRQGQRETQPVSWCRAVHDLYFRAYVVDPKHLEGMRSSPCVEPNLDPEAVNNLGRKALEKMGDYDWTEEFTRLETPTLVVHGSEDPVPLEGSLEWERCLSNGQLLALEGVGHMPWLEAPELFFEAVREFLGAGDSALS